MDVLLADRTVRLFLALSVTEPENLLVTLGGLETKADLARLGLSQVPLLDPVVVPAESGAGALSTIGACKNIFHCPSAKEKHRSLLTRVSVSRHIAW